jgi:hypothetical protein
MESHLLGLGLGIYNVVIQSVLTFGAYWDKAKVIIFQERHLNFFPHLQIQSPRMAGFRIPAWPVIGGSLRKKSSDLVAGTLLEVGAAHRPSQPLLQHHLGKSGQVTLHCSLEKDIS